MGRPNRLFPTWKKAKKGERPPGSHPPKKNRIVKPVVATLVLLGLLAVPVQATAPVTGTASWYGPGNGAAMPFCTWTYRTTTPGGCGYARITSVDTGITVTAPIIDYCFCVVGSSVRIIDLQWGVVSALGLDVSRGLYPVTVELVAGETTIPDTSMGEEEYAQKRTISFQETFARTREGWSR